MLEAGSTAMGGLITNFASSDTIELPNVPFNAGADTLDYVGGVLTITDGSGATLDTLDIASDFVTSDFTLSAGPTSGVELTTNLTVFTITDEGELNQAIASADAATSGTFDILFAAPTITEGTDTGDQILFGTQTLSAPPDLYALNLHSGVSVTIDGGADTLDGAGAYRGLFAYAGNVTINDLTIANARAAGGAGGAGYDPGGGGAGLGGGLFVAAGASVVAAGVDFIGDSAAGGNGGSYGGGGSGGGGGLGGAGGNHSGGGGGGVGVSATGGGHSHAGGPGIVLGAAGGGAGGSSSGGVYGGGGGEGGGGGVGGSNGSFQNGGAGGFGGGGGAAVAHGDGGFGGGGAGGYSGGGGGGFGGGGGAGGNGGFGAGNGAYQHSGGGGLGAGGDVFVQEGGALTIEGGSLSGGSVQRGLASNYVDNGSSYGSGIFLQGTAAITLAPLSGETLSLGDALADQSIAGGTQPAATVTIDGPGTAAASGTGDITVTDLDAASGGVLQLAGVTIATGMLTIAAGGSSGGYGTVDGGITNDGSLVASGGTLALNGEVTGTGDVQIAASAELALNGTLGSETVDGGITNDGSLVASGGTVELTGAITGTGDVQIAPNTELALDGTVGSGQTIDLSGTAGVLEAGSTAMGGLITDFNSSDTIQLPNVPFNAGADTLDYVGGVLTITDGSGATLDTLDIAGPFVTSDFTLSAGATSGVDLTTGFTKFTITDEGELNQAIASADAATSGRFDFVFANSITEGTDVGQQITFGTQTLSAPPDLYALNLARGVSVTIDGGGDTLDGAGAYRGLFAYAGDVTINDLTIADAKAAVGAGGAGGSPGGGGAGLGGGLFVAAGASVVAAGVDFIGDSATGGNGGSGGRYGGDGGGGLGGAGGEGGGGVGVLATGGTQSGTFTFGAGGSGIVLGAASGGSGSVFGVAGAGGQGGAFGGGGGAGSAGGGGVGGGTASGGFGGGGAVREHGGFGGGGGGSNPTGGGGGFGGGGGSAFYGDKGGAGGFGAGAGYAVQTFTSGIGAGGRGGGLGAGGDVFVQQGGVLTIEGGSLSGGSVQGGTGGTATNGVVANGGSAYASGIFLQGTASVTLAPLTGETLSLSDALADRASPAAHSRQRR